MCTSCSANCGGDAATRSVNSIVQFGCQRTAMVRARRIGMEKLLLKVTEAAELTGLGRSKAYELVAAGTWPSISIGRSVRVPLVGLREWVERQQAQAANEHGRQN